MSQLIRKVAERGSKFLETIGSAQMEQELIMKVVPLIKQQELTAEKETGINPSLTDQEIKQYLQDVFAELRRGKK